MLSTSWFTVDELKSVKSIGRTHFKVPYVPVRHCKVFMSCNCTNKVMFSYVGGLSSTGIKQVPEVNGRVNQLNGGGKTCRNCGPCRTLTEFALMCRMLTSSFCRCASVIAMSKHHILIYIDPSQPSTSKQPKPSCQTNWTLSTLCHSDTCKVLQCPAKSTKKSVGRGYVSLASDLLQVQELENIPADLNLDRLDEVNGIGATLTAHSASGIKLLD